MPTSTAQSIRPAPVSRSQASLHGHHQTAFNAYPSYRKQAAPVRRDYFLGRTGTMEPPSDAHRHLTHKIGLYSRSWCSFCFPPGDELKIIITYPLVQDPYKRAAKALEPGVRNSLAINFPFFNGHHPKTPPELE